VLELCSGTGLNTYALVQTGARVLASDISSKSLEVLSTRIVNVKTSVADIENLPFEEQSFDVVSIAGSLSYGAPDLVDAEIRRVLRPGGIFICVDSLSHNPIYKFNRWFHYMKGDRTKSTLRHMPTMERIQSISSGFSSAEVRYFGAVSYLMPVLARIVGQNRAAEVSDAVDRFVNVRRAAFKFVLVARGRL
jgi:ubiquinone/menaquinone biosynthesis C-methylase UbiE